jgi:hypothetical protein
MYCCVVNAEGKMIEIIDAKEAHKRIILHQGQYYIPKAKAREG